MAAPLDAQTRIRKRRRDDTRGERGVVRNCKMGLAFSQLARSELLLAGSALLAPAWAAPALVPASPAATVERYGCTMCGGRASGGGACLTAFCVGGRCGVKDSQTKLEAQGYTFNVPEYCTLGQTYTCTSDTQARSISCVAPDTPPAGTRDASLWGSGQTRVNRGNMQITDANNGASIQQEGDSEFDAAHALQPEGVNPWRQGANLNPWRQGADFRPAGVGQFGYLGYTKDGAADAGPQREKGVREGTDQLPAWEQRRNLAEKEQLTKEVRREARNRFRLQAPLHRRGHTFSPWGGRCGILFGGLDNYGVVHNGLWQFDFGDRQWTKVQVGGIMPPARYRHVAIVVKEMLVIFGGNDLKSQSATGGVLSDTWLFSHGSSRWEALGAPQKLAAASSVETAGGRDEQTPPKSPLPPARELSCAVEYKRRLLLFGGGAPHARCTYGIGDGIGGTEKYVGTFKDNDACAQYVALNYPAANGATFGRTLRRTDGTLINGRHAKWRRGRCYAEFGMASANTNHRWETCLLTRESFLNDVWQLDLATRMWAETSTDASSPRPSQRRAHACALVGQSLFVFGGYGGASKAHALGDFWELDLSGVQEIASATAVWRERVLPAARPAARFAHSFLSMGRLALFGGSDGERLHNDVWLFDIYTNVWVQGTFDGSARRPCPRQDQGAVAQGLHLCVHGGFGSFDGLGSAKFLNDMWCANPWHNWKWQWNEFEGVPLTLYEQGNWRRDLSKLEEQPVNNFFEYTDEKAEASHAPSADDLVV